ncbi:MAG TPA: papain-like cysteine protease family protein [Myxococcales bacterium]|nr:papain-like cysteine protease family protein [Myxococcales bacterium]
MAKKKSKAGRRRPASRRRPARASLLGGAPAVAPVAALPYPAELQQYSNWCWAAVGSCTDRFYRGTKIQCEVAGLQFPDDDCCADAGPCNEPSRLDEVLDALRRLQNWSEGYAAKADLQSEIGKKHVVAARIEWNGGGGHFIAMVGYDSPSDIVVVEDPAFGRKEVPFDELRDHYLGKGFWTHTYWTKA